jgi:hypothetical protein
MHQESIGLADLTDPLAKAADQDRAHVASAGRTA